jgi:branched-chain amino acid transport system ATP-binding protein
MTFSGTPLTGPPHKRFHQGVTLVPEDRKVFPNLSVRENLQVAVRPPATGRGFTMDDATDLFPRLRERFDQKAGTLSGGEQQMLVVARAMLANPRFILLDEPTEGLAPNYVEAIRDAIVAARDLGTGVILVEQSLPLAHAVGDRFHVMENGALVLSADRDAILADPGQLERLLTVE